MIRTFKQLVCSHEGAECRYYSRIYDVKTNEAAYSLALKSGWLRKKGQYFCPYCRSEPVPEVRKIEDQDMLDLYVVTSHDDREISLTRLEKTVGGYYRFPQKDNGNLSCFPKNVRRISKPNQL